MAREVVAIGMLDMSDAACVPFGQMTERTEQICISSNMGEVIYRVIHDVKTIKPSRFQYADADDEDDQTGWIWLNGQRVAVETSYWGDVLIWRLAEPDEQEGDGAGG